MFSFSGYFTNGSDWERFGEGSPTCFSFGRTEMSISWINQLGGALK